MCRQPCAIDRSRYKQEKCSKITRTSDFCEGKMGAKLVDGETPVLVLQNSSSVCNARLVMWWLASYESIVAAHKMGCLQEFGISIREDELY